MIRNVSHLSLIFIIYVVHHAVIGQKCHTSTGNGICIPIRDCNSIVHQLADNHISDTLKQEIRQLQCGYRNGSPYVCCDLNTLYPYRAEVERYTNSKITVSSKLGNLFPASDKCGVDLSSDAFRINDVGMYEHPGMVVLTYDNGKMGCGGTLINHRYVLTAASCVSGDIVEKCGRLVSVRLGEHNLDNDPDCDYSDSCQNYVDYQIAEIVVPKEFVTSAEHDVGLIRLAEDVDTIKNQPLCLTEPIDLYTDHLRIVGWGITCVGKIFAERKYLGMDYLNETECNNMIEQPEISNVRPPTHAICTKLQPLRKMSTCPLDGGGVLMARSQNDRWTIVGLSSYWPDCGVGNQSATIFTDISHHLDWIQYNMRP